MDAHIDAIQELHEELDRLRATCREQGQDELASDLFMAGEIVLVEFEKQLLDSYQLAYNKITRSGRRDSFNPITIPKFPIPTLLKHNQTVLKLETVGVRARMRPDDLKLILERLGVPRNNIKVQIKVARKGIKANITCTKLADSCRLQCISLLKKTNLVL